ncbi:MAG: DUF4124 domain-containing protein [Acidiferrobacterales bacterium]
MFRLSLLAVVFALAASITFSAQAAIYVWKDANGVTNFANDPKNVPSGVQPEVRSYDRFTRPTAAAEPRAVRQGELALQLVTELGLGENLSEQEAARVLTQARIAPPLGKWRLDQPLTQGLLSRLRKLTASAAVSGRIPVNTDDALYAFDTAAALVRTKIRDVATRDAPVRRAIEPEPVPIYVAPPLQPVAERVVFVGGGPVFDPFLHGLAGPQVINIDNRVINKRVVIVRPERRSRPKGTVLRNRFIARPPKDRGSPRFVRGQRLRGAAGGPAVTRVVPQRQAIRARGTTTITRATGTRRVATRGRVRVGVRRAPGATRAASGRIGGRVGGRVGGYAGGGGGVSLR